MFFLHSSRLRKHQTHLFPSPPSNNGVLLNCVLRHSIAPCIAVTAYVPSPHTGEHHEKGSDQESQYGHAVRSSGAGCNTYAAKGGGNTPVAVPRVVDATGKLVGEVI